MEKKALTNFDVLIRGQLSVNLPIITIMILIFGCLGEFTDFPFFRNIVFSFIPGWILWGFLVKNWIKWAKKNDVSNERLLKIGKPGLLVWNIHTIETVTKHNKYPWI